MRKILLNLCSCTVDLQRKYSRLETARSLDPWLANYVYQVTLAKSPGSRWEYKHKRTKRAKLTDGHGMCKKYMIIEVL